MKAEETTAEDNGTVSSNDETESEILTKAETDPEVDPEPPLLSPTKSSTDFLYEPGKVSIKFLFANRDGLNVRIQCDLTDTVATVKGSLLSLWPEELESCSEGGRIRLICMGKGILQPDGITLEQCDIPVFKTHATPVNVSLRPSKVTEFGGSAKKNSSSLSPMLGASATAHRDCCCVVQ